MAQAKSGPPTVTVLDVDPDLGGDIPEAELPLARRVTVSRALDLPPGPVAFEPPAAYGDRPFALLVVAGLLTREVALGDRGAAQLLGAGDVVDPWARPDPLVRTTVRWTVNDDTRLAVLDDRFLAAARRWPCLTRALLGRTIGQWDRAATHTAICQLPHVETRIVGLLWHLAQRWGRVTVEGVVVPLALTHEAVGRLVGAQRPTVSLALRALAEQDAVVRRDDGCWLLAHASRAALADDDAPPSAELGIRLVAAGAEAAAPRGAPARVD